MRFAGAGDNYVGRVLAGLPTGDARFAILPSLFKEQNAILDGVLKE